MGGTSSLGSAAVPPPGPGDHVRGRGPEVVLYLDLACPRCADTWAEIAALPLQLCVRHFPIASRRPRSPVLHAAAEAVAIQSEDGFWAFWDSLLADRAHVDDPHLWERVEALGLDLDRFQRDRRSDPVAERVRRDFRSGISAGVAATPAGFAAGTPLAGELVGALRELSSR
ncbi:MAG TPA: DsbA family protein [Solirubrobacterales bacterium]|jgi:protein-disulfide isomerase|nr:DsbA family protein [Solirubrobacterales bacterium]